MDKIAIAFSYAEFYQFRQNMWSCAKLYGVTANHPHESEYSQARQFFYILSGQATMRLADGEEVLNVGDGIEIAPMEAHQMINASCGEIEFIVASAPKSHGDKVLVH